MHFYLCFGRRLIIFLQKICKAKQIKATRGKKKREEEEEKEMDLVYLREMLCCEEINRAGD